MIIKMGKLRKIINIQNEDMDKLPDEVTVDFITYAQEETDKQVFFLGPTKESVMYWPTIELKVTFK